MSGEDMVKSSCSGGRTGLGKNDGICDLTLNRTLDIFNILAKAYFRGAGGVPLRQIVSVFMDR